MIFEKVKYIIAQEAGVENQDLTLETSLKDDLNLDSLSAVEISMALEDEFEIEITEDDAETFKTLGDIVDFLHNNL